MSKIPYSIQYSTIEVTKIVQFKFDSNYIKNKLIGNINQFSTPKMTPELQKYRKSWYAECNRNPAYLTKYKMINDQFESVQ